MGEVTGCFEENQVRSKLLKPLDKSAFGGFASSGILAKWSRITSLACPNLFAILSCGRISSDFCGNWQMKNEAEVKIKKGAAFQTRNRLGLPDENFCFCGDSAGAKII